MPKRQPPVQVFCDGGPLHGGSTVVECQHTPRCSQFEVPGGDRIVTYHRVADDFAVYLPPGDTWNPA